MCSARRATTSTRTSCVRELDDIDLIGMQGTRRKHDIMARDCYDTRRLTDDWTLIE